MKELFSFLAPGSPEDVQKKAAEFLEGAAGFSRERKNSRTFLRGSRWGRSLSPRVAVWPTRLRLSCSPASAGQTLLCLAFDVRSGLHPVGAMEKAALEAEAALLQEWLLRGLRRRPDLALRPLWRTLGGALLLNAVLSTTVVAAVGLMAGYHPLAVGLLALMVGLLDGIAITAFADLMLERGRALPRLWPVSPVASAPLEGTSLGR